MSGAVGNGEASDRLAELRAATSQRIAGLQEGFEDIVEATSDVATDDEHDPEGHTIAWERQQIAALLEEARATLAAVEVAACRIDDGTYGECVSCGRPIGSARLEALPAASECVVCAA